jgi:PPOX class probable F420-dependent enzyme
MAKLTEAQRAFLRDNAYAGVLTTVRPDGSPHATPVWVDVAGDEVLVNTRVGRAKERHLRENPGVSLTVVDPHDMYHWVSITGRATLDPEGAYEHINTLSHRYSGEDYSYIENEQRVIARIKVEKIDSSGFG